MINLNPEKAKSRMECVFISILWAIVVAPLTGFTVGLLFAFAFWDMDWTAILGVTRVFSIIVGIIIVVACQKAWEDEQEKENKNEKVNG